MRIDVAVGVAVSLLAALVLAGEAWGGQKTARILATVPSARRARPGLHDRLPLVRRRAGGLLLRVGAVAGGVVLGLRLMGPVGVAAGAASGWAVPGLVERRRQARREESLERQLADVVETVAAAVRSGMSIAQAVEFAAAEAPPPIRELLHRVVSERQVGASIERALGAFAEAIGTDDGRLFVLILTIHQRSGGNVAGALEEVSSTVRHRVAVRRELRALTAQGRVSGAVLGALPIGFFLVLATTSGGELGPIYRSAAGIGMVGAGLVLEGLAYLWIRRLLRVEV
jgi:tight adherence protein B